MKYNFGKLKNKTSTQKNIVYYRKGKDEMSINLTNKCPNSCCFCIRDRDPGWGVSNLYMEKDPSLDEIKKAIKEAWKNNVDIKVKKVKICGYGEPILRIDIVSEIVKFIKEICPEVTIQLTTTGWPLYYVGAGEKHFRESVESGLDDICLGLNALNSEDYRRYVNPSINSDEAFKQVLRFIRLSKELGLRVLLSFVNLDNQNKKAIKIFSDKFKCEYNIREFER